MRRGSKRALRASEDPGGPYVRQDQSPAGRVSVVATTTTATVEWNASADAAGAAGLPAVVPTVPL